jgi:hypothetical protein
MPELGNENVQPLGSDQNQLPVGGDLGAFLQAGGGKNLPGPLTSDEFERWAALAFRRLWMTAIGAEEEEIQEACTSLAGEISYQDELDNLESVRRLLQGEDVR